MVDSRSSIGLASSTLLKSPSIYTSKMKCVPLDNRLAGCKVHGWQHRHRWGTRMPNSSCWCIHSIRFEVRYWNRVCAGNSNLCGVFSRSTDTTKDFVVLRIGYCTGCLGRVSGEQLVVPLTHSSNAWIDGRVVRRWVSTPPLRLAAIEWMRLTELHGAPRIELWLIPRCSCSYGRYQNCRFGL